MLKYIDEQATVVESYPYFTEQDIFWSLDKSGMAILVESSAKDISVPPGCEAHHEVWTQAMKKLMYSAISVGKFVSSGSSKDEDFARLHRREGLGYLDEANQIYRRIERQGCGG